MILWASYTNSPFILHSLTWRSSAPDTINGSVGWKHTQLTPRSWPSSTCFTIASVWPNSSGDPGVLRWSRPPGPGATFFFLKPETQAINQSINQSNKQLLNHSSNIIYRMNLKTEWQPAQSTAWDQKLKKIITLKKSLKHYNNTTTSNISNMPIICSDDYTIRSSLYGYYQLKN